MNLKTKIATLALGAMMAMGVGSAITFASNNNMSGAQAAEANVYQHVFDAKPKTGDDITLSGKNWNITATSLNGYNSANYAGVQIGSSSSAGRLTLTSKSAWTYNDKTEISEVRLWLNTGGSSVTPTVTIGGVNAISDNATIVKNSSACSDWKKATLVTFTPSTVNSGVIVIDIATVKAGYVCCLEIEMATVQSKTLESISISGSMTKTDYYVGDNWDYTGLTATATYSEGDPEDVTDKVTWSFNPGDADNTSITSVEVIASIDDVESDPYEQNVTVSYGPAKTIEEALEMVQGEPYTITGVITNVKGNNFFMQDNTGAIYVYGNNVSYINNATTGDKVRVSGSNKLYKGLIECEPAAIERIITGEPVLPVDIFTYEEYVAAKQSSYVNVSGLTYSSGTISDNDNANSTLKFSLEGEEISVYFPGGLGDRNGIINALGDMTDPTARYALSSVNIGWYDGPQIEVIRAGQIVRYTEIVALDYIEASSISTYVGESANIEVEFSPSNATNKVVTFTSLDETVATVNETGLVTGVASGTTQIEIDPSDENASTIYVDVTVSAAPSRVYQKVTSNLSDYTGTYLIAYELNDGTAKVFNGTDASHDYVIADVREGYIEKTSTTDQNSVTIASRGDGGYSIQISPTNANGNASKYIYGANGSNTISFNTNSSNSVNEISVSNGNVSIVSNTSTFKFNSAAGDSYDRFRYYKSSTTSADIVLPQLFKLVVGEYPSLPDDVMPESIEINEGTSGTLSVGETKQLTATILPSNTTNKDVHWSIDNDDVAMVENGLITAKAVGTATVTVACDADRTITDTYSLTVNQASTNSYKLVTNNSQLIPGAKYIFAGIESNSYYFMKTYESGNNIGRVGGTVSGDIATPSSGYGEYVLGYDTKGYSFEDKNGNYLYAAGASSNNYLKAQSTLTNPGYWSISISDNGVATIKTTDSSVTRNTIRHNTGNDIFACYASGQADVYLYVDTASLLNAYLETYLHMTDYTGEGTGLCSGNDGYYAKAKAQLLAMGNDYVTLFQNDDTYNDAQARYEAWAIVCGDNTPYGVSSSNAHSLVNVQSDNTMITIVVISMLSTVSIAAYLRLRKKKEN